MMPFKSLVPGSIRRYLMTQVTDFSAEEVTFRWLQFQAVLHESLQHGTEAHQVFLLGLGVNDHIVQVERVLKERVTILRPCKFPDLFLNQLRINIEMVYIPNVVKNNTSTHN